MEDGFRVWTNYWGTPPGKVNKIQGEEREEDKEGNGGEGCGRVTYKTEGVG